MLNVQRSYQERLEVFTRNHSEILDIVWQVFPPADRANADDLIELRKVVTKIEEAHQAAVGYFNVRKMLGIKRAAYL